MIIGNFVELVPICQENLEKMVHWRNDPEVSSFMFDRSQFTLSNQLIWFQNILNDKTRVQFIIRIKESEIPIGVANLMNLDHYQKTCEWGYYIGEVNYRLSCFAIEAQYLMIEYVFETLKMENLYCKTLMTNKKMITLNHKFGFSDKNIFDVTINGTNTVEKAILQNINKNQFNGSKNEILSIINYFKR